MVEYVFESAIELASATRQLVRCRGQVIAAHNGGNTAESPKRPLQSSNQRLESFAKRKHHRPPLAETQDKLEQEVRERLPCDGNAQ
jgi:hypothetical protein